MTSICLSSLARMGGPESPEDHAMTEELLTSRWTEEVLDGKTRLLIAGLGATRACVNPTR